MSAHFAELDWRETPIGAISLRRRWDISLGIDVYEIKLDDDFLTSSLFTQGEAALARLALAEVPGTDLDVAVGGLGLGYTAQGVLADPRVNALVVVEALDEVIEWHERGLLPLSRGLTEDPRYRTVHGDFFARFTTEAEPAASSSPQRFHAILVDIDHSPGKVLHPSHAPFYQPEGLHRLAAHLHPDGVFALWSDDPPDATFTATLTTVFATAQAHVVEFPHPVQKRTAANTVYVARTP